MLSVSQSRCRLRLSPQSQRSFSHRQEAHCGGASAAGASRACPRPAAGQVRQEAAVKVIAKATSDQTQLQTSQNQQRCRYCHPPLQDQQQQRLAVCDWRGPCLATRCQGSLGVRRQCRVRRLYERLRQYQLPCSVAPRAQRGCAANLLFQAVLSSARDPHEPSGGAGARRRAARRLGAVSLLATQPRPYPLHPPPRQARQPVSLPQSLQSLVVRHRYH